MKFNKYILPGLLIVAIIVLLWRGCSISKQFANKQSTIDSLMLANQRLDSLTNKQGQTIYTQQSIIADNTEALDKLTDSIFDLKRKDEKNTKTIAYYKASNSINLTGVNVPYLDSVAMKEFSDSVKAQCKEVIDYYQNNTIAVGRQSGDSTANYQIVQTVKKEGIEINQLIIPDTLQLRFVEHKHGLFRPKTIETQFFHSNPLVQTTQSNSVFYVPKRKSFFVRVILPTLVGVGAGILIAK